MKTRRSNAAVWIVTAVLGISAFPALPAQGAEWRALFNHVHTIYSQDNAGWEWLKPSVAEVVARANTVGGQMGMETAVTITDHNVIDGIFDPGFAPIGVAQPVKGEEWGGDGHAGVLDFTGDTPIPSFSGPDRNEQMIAEAHARGGLVIANHPRDNAWERDRRLGIDAIEIWNTTWSPVNEKALAWWQRLLAAGERVTAVGGSDAHFKLLPIESPQNILWAESNGAHDMVEAVRQGHGVIAATPNSPRVFLAADLDGDGNCDDAIVGDAVAIAGPTTIEFEAVVQGATATDLLVLVDETGTFFTGNVGSGPGWVGTAYRFSRAFSESAKSFIRAELRNQSGAPHGFTNPIYAVGVLAPAGTEGTLQGRVTDAATSAPLGGVAIQVTPGEYSTAITDAAGAWSITVPDGTYSVQASLQGYLAGKREGVEVRNGVVAADIAISKAACGSVDASERSAAAGGAAWLFLIAAALLARLGVRKSG